MARVQSSYANIDDLRNDGACAAELASGDGTVRLGGYEARGDGGGGVYAVTSAKEDNGGTVLRTRSGATLEYVESGPVPVSVFGVLGIDSAKYQTTNRARLNAMVAKLGHGRTYYVPPGVYWFDNDGQNCLRLAGLNGVSFVGAGCGSVEWRYAGQPGRVALLKLVGTQRASFTGICFNANRRADVAVWLTSEGAESPGNTSENMFSSCVMQFAREYGVRVGSYVNEDVTLDGNHFFKCAMSDNGLFGVSVTNSNSNTTTIDSCNILNNGPSGGLDPTGGGGVEVALYARGVTVRKSSAVHNGQAFVVVRRTFADKLIIEHHIMELYTHGLLYVEGADGGVQATGEITVNHWSNTYNNMTGATFPLVDYRGAGSLAFNHCRFHGGDEGAALRVQPPEVATPGAHLLMTNDAQCQGGATWDVRTRGNGKMRWIDISADGGVRLLGGGAISADLTVDNTPDDGTADFPVTVVSVDARGLVGAGWYRYAVHADKISANTNATTIFLNVLGADMGISAVYMKVDPFETVGGLTQVMASVGGSGAGLNAESFLLPVSCVRASAKVFGGDPLELGAALATPTQGRTIPAAAPDVKWQAVVRLAAVGATFGDGVASRITAGRLVVLLKLESVPWV